MSKSSVNTIVSEEATNIYELSRNFDNQLIGIKDLRFLKSFSRYFFILAAVPNCWENKDSQKAIFCDNF